MPYPIDKYEAQAAKTFPVLVEKFAKWDNWWQIGNVFDTLTDYLVRFPDAARTIPGSVAEIAFDRFLNAANTACWYDDYGWWGIASEKVFHNEYAPIFAGHETTFQDITKECWNVMNTGKQSLYFSYRGGPNVWDNRANRKPTDYFTSPGTWAVPRFTGGVWQYEMFKDKRKAGERSPSNPSDPNKTQLGPFQLTVMNGLFLVLALRLTQHRISGAREAVTNEIGFLKNWFSLDQHPQLKGDEGLLMRFPRSPFVLVRERVPTYAYCDAKRSHPKVDGYASETAWCGDQGLILGALVDYAILEDPTPADIAGGVLRHMVDANQVVLPTLKLDTDTDDYGCGSGVFWRYLLRGFHQDAVLHQQVLDWVNGDRENNPIYRSAEYACTNGGPGNELFADFNVLATMTAAIDILQAADQ